MTTPPGWDEAYAEGVLSPWDIGRPQPVFAQLADRGLLGGGRVLDVGCGTGEQTPAAGADAMGVDISPRAIERARDKAAGHDQTRDSRHRSCSGIRAVKLPQGGHGKSG
jgi:SAM-dependent methyltransferase